MKSLETKVHTPGGTDLINNDLSLRQTVLQLFRPKNDNGLLSSHLSCR